jgi:PAS domain S-box-containing protein
MSRPSIHVTGVERTFGADEIIVSKTDSRGIITYANRVFVRISGYSESELLGQPHNILRHPDMPRVVFKTMWETIRSGREIFAYVNNRCKNGDHYWVFAHVTPTFDGGGNIVGYHSSRRCPDRAKVSRISALYDQLLAVERRYANPRAQMEASAPVLHAALGKLGMPYDEFVFSL